MENDFLFKEETYKIIGLAMKVHSHLGCGFKEVVYKDALEIEFINNNVPYTREKTFLIDYFGNILKHSFDTDFFVFNSIVVEAKAKTNFHSDHFDQALNYLKAAKAKVGLVLNFGKKSFEFKRVVYSA